MSKVSSASHHRSTGHCLLVRHALAPCLPCKLASYGGLSVANTAAGFEAETEDELSVDPGDEVTVQVEVEGWVQITRERDGKKGLVPASYLQTA